LVQDLRCSWYLATLLHDIATQKTITYN
jgi:hypothetical protein